MGQGTTGATVPTPTVMPPHGTPGLPPQGGPVQGTFAQQHDMLHNQMGMPQQMPAPMLASAGGINAAVNQGPGMSGMQSWDMKPALDMQANNYNPMATTDQLKPAGGAK
jgi:hypothetical protein